MALRPRLWPGVPWTWKVHGVWGSVQPLGVMADRTTSPLLNRIGRRKAARRRAGHRRRGASAHCTTPYTAGGGLSARLLTTPVPLRISPLAPLVGES